MGASSFFFTKLSYDIFAEIARGNFYGLADSLRGGVGEAEAPLTFNRKLKPRQKPAFGHASAHSPHGIEDGEHAHAHVRKDGQPHAGDAQRAQHEHDGLDSQREDDVLPGDAKRPAGQTNGAGEAAGASAVWAVSAFFLVARFLGAASAAGAASAVSAFLRGARFLGAGSAAGASAVTAVSAFALRGARFLGAGFSSTATGSSATGASSAAGAAGVSSVREKSVAGRVRDSYRSMYLPAELYQL